MDHLCFVSEWLFVYDIFVWESFSLFVYWSLVILLVSDLLIYCYFVDKLLVGKFAYRGFIGNIPVDTIDGGT